MPLSWPGREVFFTGMNQVDQSDLTTATSPRRAQEIPKMTGDNYGSTIQPDVQTYAGDPAINGTMFIAITDSDPYLSVVPFLKPGGSLVMGAFL
ncbi:hypothetical protein APSETT445_005209 [Aspergillus pseudonomiae]